MKQLFSYVCVLFLVIQPLFVISLSTQKTNAQVTQEILTNTNIIELTNVGLSSEAIIEKIKNSKTNFDLSASSLQSLKTSKVADEVIVVMLQANSSNNITQTTQNTVKEVEVTIPDGTEIEVQLKNNLSGQDEKIGDIVDLVVVRDVVVSGIKVISEGSSATARITNAKKAGYWGKSGKLEWAMQDVQTVGGKRIPSRFTKAISGGSNSGSVAVGAVVTTVLLGPVGLLWGLKKGKKAIIPAGSKFSVYTDKNSMIMAKTNL